MWGIIAERYWFFRRVLPQQAMELQQKWDARPEHTHVICPGAKVGAACVHELPVALIGAWVGRGLHIDRYFTLLTGVDPAMSVSCQEIFGPVVCIVPFSTLDEAIARVNATPYGLATGLFTNRLDDALKAARRLEVGGVHINETSSSRVDVMPYGGSKDSGFGREGPHYAVREMSEERMVTIAS